MNKPSGQHLQLTWECLSNLYDGEKFLSELTLRNLGQAALPASGWAIYFNTCRKIVPETVTGGMQIAQVNGDLSRMAPAPEFTGLAVGETLVVRFVSELWVISETDAPLGFYIVYDDGTPEAHAEVIGDPQIRPYSGACHKRREIDNVPAMTPELRFADNSGVTALPESEVGRITPTPLQAEFGEQHFVIRQHTMIVHDAVLSSEAAFLRACLHDQLGEFVPLAAQGTGIVLRIGSVDAPAGPTAQEAYSLQIDADGVVITGASAHGVWNGIQSLRQLLPLASYANPQPQLPVPYCKILDAPRFAYRGMMLDVARHFVSKDTVKRFLDCMALYKLNKFHFHITDDEGWRIEITSLPELTSFGSRRGFSVNDSEMLCPSFGSGADPSASQGSGFYTRAEFIELLRYATERHIEVVPEFNLPGHSRAAIKAMDYRYRRLMAEGKPAEAEAFLLSDPDDASRYESVQLWHDNVTCIARESTYRFIETVIAEIVALFAEADAPLTTLHTGGDEIPAGAWEGSPICQRFMQERGMKDTEDLQDYFHARYREILNQYGLVFGGWEEIALHRETREDGTTHHAPNPLFVNANFRPYVWNNTWGGGQEDFAYQLANAGYEVVLCNVTNLYFDLAYAKDPKEPGYYWGGFISTRSAFEFCPLDIFSNANNNSWGNPLDAATLAQKQRLTAKGAANVLGIQGQIWGENSRNCGRIEYSALPRIISLAERAWAKDPGWCDIEDDAKRRSVMQADWNQFANRLGQRELPRLDYLNDGYGYRIPLPGAVVKDGKLHANISTPGLAIRYTLDGSEPIADSPRYNSPIAISPSAIVRLATFSATGRKSRTVELTQQP